MPTFVALGTVTGGANQLIFSSIPQTYKDLAIIGSGGSNFNADTATCRLQINGSSAGIYAWQGFRGDNNSPSGTASVGNDGVYFTMPAINATTHNGSVIMRFVDYANTSRQKTCLIFSGGNMTGTSSATIGVTAGFINTTSAISSITLIGSSGVAWTSTSTFTLYGIGLT